MEGKLDRKISGRFLLGRQSSLAQEHLPEDDEEEDKFSTAEEIEQTLELLFCAHQGNKEGIETLLADGMDVNKADLDDRTALHVAACEGRLDVVKLLLAKGANVNAQDRWGSTPLQDANHYGCQEVSEWLEKNGGRLPSSMHSEFPPEYEINPDSLCFKKDMGGNYKEYDWTGTRVVVKTLSSSALSNKNLEAFRDELAVLQKLRHPNVVQFLGAVTQTTPMMIVTEYLPTVLHQYLDKKRKQRKRVDTAKVVKLALDLARGMNYLHERKPEAIILHDLSPRSLMVDKAGHLKVAGFSASLMLCGGFDGKLVQIPFSTFTKFSTDYEFKSESIRYMAPELTRQEDYDGSVDVFSFSLIVQEMVEGCAPFADKTPQDAARMYAFQDERPPFKASLRRYPGKLKGLIERCWDAEKRKRPCFNEIIKELEEVSCHMKESRWLAKVKKYLLEKTSVRGA